MSQKRDKEIISLLLYGGKNVQCKGETALNLSRKLHCTKKEVNRELYKLETEGIVYRGISLPPLWRLSMDREEEEKEKQDTSNKKVIVIVDLGNIHNVLQELEPYIKSNCIQEVWAYADKQFNGYGVNPKPSLPRCTVWQASQPRSNAADNKIVWDVALACQTSNPIHFIVVTKDQGFSNIKELAEKDGVHTLEFANSWEELRNVIE